MAIPTFFAAGAGTDGTGTTLAPAYPASVANNDIAILQIVSRTSTDNTPTVPGDWTNVGADVTGHNHHWYWKRLDGTETGTVSVSNLPGGGIGAYARIYVFRGCLTSGNPYEAQTSTNGSGTSYSSSAITTLGTDRLAVCLIYISDDDKTIAGMTGSNVTWAESVAEFASAAGSDGTLSCQQADVAAATSITAGSESYSGSETWMTFTFALKPAAATAFSLDSQPASFSFTGLAATLAWAHLFDSQPAAYTVTGAAAAIVSGRAVNAQPGAYAVAGSDATLLTTRVLSADPGSYAVTGDAATVAAGRVFAADPGSVAITGDAAATVAGPAVLADPGSYAVTGADAALVHTTVGAYTLDIDPGTFDVTGTDATLAAGRLLGVDPGSFAVTGFDATFVVTVPGVFTIDAQPAAFTVTGASASTVATRLFDASPGSYTITGDATTLFAEHSIAATAGTLSVTGTAATVAADRTLDASPGTIAVTGINAAIGSIFDMEINAETGNVTVGGASADLVFAPGLARLTTRGGRLTWNTTGGFRGENHAGRITQNKEGAVA